MKRKNTPIENYDTLRRQGVKITVLPEEKFDRGDNSLRSSFHFQSRCAMRNKRVVS